MLIGIDASRANRKFKTGTEWYGYHIIEELKRISPQDGVSFVLYSPDKLRENLKHLPQAWQEKQLRWPLKYLWTQIRLFWETKKHPPDVLFVPSHTLPVFCKSKSVVTIHDICFETHPHCYSLFQRIYYKMIHRRAAKIAKHIIVPSQFTKQQLIELYKIDKDKISVIPLAYDKNNFYRVNDEKKIKVILNKYNIKQPYFLFVGRLEKKKNIENLLKAYSKLLMINNHLTIPSLVLVGKPGYGYKRIKNYESPTGVVSHQTRIKNVREIGYVEADDLKYLYNWAEAFIFPSLCEGFGIPILEAMACGCPLLVSNIAPFCEIAQDSAIYFNPNDINEIVEAMKAIIQNRDFRDGLVQKGLDQVNNFSWKKCAEQSINILLK